MSVQYCSVPLRTRPLPINNISTDSLTSQLDCIIYILPRYPFVDYISCWYASYMPNSQFPSSLQNLSQELGLHN